MQEQKGVSTLVGTIIIVLAAVVLFGGAFAWQYYTLKSQIPISNVQTNPNPQNSNSQTAGWKTYQNEQYGLEFRYPENANVEIGGQFDQCIVIILPGDFGRIGYGGDLSAQYCGPTSATIGAEKQEGNLKVGDQVYSASGYYASEYDNWMRADVKGHPLIVSLYDTNLNKPTAKQIAENKQILSSILSTFKFTK